mmetsp:Transcript_23742/g.47183  ORF Transcript_23742/g.47183 Transcript_23742/m.47183 type:complete len:261 (-) Transcript_23742:744-1526(-)
MGCTTTPLSRRERGLPRPASSSGERWSPSMVPNMLAKSVFSKGGRGGRDCPPRARCGTARMGASQRLFRWLGPPIESRTMFHSIHPWLPAPRSNMMACALRSARLHATLRSPPAYPVVGQWHASVPRMIRARSPPPVAPFAGIGVSSLSCRSRCTLGVPCAPSSSRSMLPAYQCSAVPSIYCPAPVSPTSRWSIQRTLWSLLWSNARSFTWGASRRSCGPRWDAIHCPSVTGVCEHASHGAGNSGSFCGVSAHTWMPCAR